MMKFSGKQLSIPFAIVLAFVASIMPVTSYLISLSLFGLPHIYYELSYINNRCGNHMSTSFKTAILLVLCLLCSCSLVAIIVPITYYVEMVLALAFLLILITYIYVPSMLCFSLLLGFAAAVTFNPILVFFLMAFLHNFSPWAFLKERQASQNAFFIFIILPILISCASHYLSLDYSIHTESQIPVYLAHYIPLPWQQFSFTKAIFATAVYLQLIHYDSTIRLLPSYMTSKIKLPVIIIMIFAIAYISFMINFAMSRSFYSIFAAFHAWLEVPVLLALFSYKMKFDSSDKLLSETYP